MEDRRSNVIRGGNTSVKDASFEAFSDKPVNYHKDVLAEHTQQRAQSETEPQVREEDVQNAVARETEKLRREFELKLQEQLKTAGTQAQASAEDEFGRAIDLLKQYATVLQSEKEELASRYEQEVLELAFDIAGKILGQRLEEHPESIALMTRQALKQVIECKRITVRANPDDIAHLQNLRTDIADQLSQDTRFELISDSKVQPGGCVIDTDRGSLDARVDSQLETLKNNLQTNSE